MRQSQQAFTLIELMVVMAIMTVIFSLIGPLAQNQVDKVRASEEWYRLSNKTSQWAADAYFHGREIDLLVDGKRLIVRSSGLPDEIIEFVYISFPRQQVRFNTHGYPDQLILTAQLRQQPRQLDLLNPDVLITGSRP